MRSPQVKNTPVTQSETKSGTQAKRQLTMPDHRDQYVSDQVVAAVLGIGRSTVWAWVASGKLPEPKRWGNRCSRWKWAEILDAIEGL